jgi:dihydrofolate reductase
VASRTLTDPLEWQNSQVLKGDVAQAVAALKREDGKDLHVIGSAEFVRTLIEHDLVDGVASDDGPGRPGRRKGHLPP